MNPFMPILLMPLQQQKVYLQTVIIVPLFAFSVHMCYEEVKFMSNYLKNEAIAEILNSYNSGGISREETDRQLLALIELEERKPFHKMNPGSMLQFRTES